MLDMQVLQPHSQVLPYRPLPAVTELINGYVIIVLFASTEFLSTTEKKRKKDMVVARVLDQNYLTIKFGFCGEQTSFDLAAKL